MESPDVGASFGAAAAEYERGRPGWPETILDALPLAPTADVLDLAAGTGKLTRVLVRHYRNVVAVEPLSELRSVLQLAVPPAEVLPGRAEAIPLADGSTDAVFVAQAFHWFANDEAVAEIGRVLRPSGLLVLLWNEPRPGAASPLPRPYRERFLAIKEEVDLPTVDWDVLSRGGFGELHESSVDHEQVSSRDDVLAFAASQSWIACRPEDERRRVLGELGDCLPEAEYRFPLRAEVRWTLRG